MEICSVIIEKTEDKNPADHKDGSTPLHHAAENGHLAICSLIIGNIEDKNPAENNNGYTALHYAAIKGHLDICKLIVEKVKNKNPESFNGTPLHLAAKYGHLKICKLLIENGADKKQISNGKTAFQIALKEPFKSSFRQLRICSFLMNGLKDLLMLILHSFACILLLIMVLCFVLFWIFFLPFLITLCTDAEFPHGLLLVMAYSFYIGIGCYFVLWFLVKFGAF